MKKFVALLLAVVMVFAMASCSSGSGNDTKAAENYKVAMITDYGDITDQSFNQTTYEACKAFSEDKGISFSYFKPAGDSDAERVAMIEKAIDEGYNVIVTPGYAFAAAVKETAGSNSGVKFITLDIGEGDWGDYTLPENVYAAVYSEQYCGFMAGYAAVKMGYTSLGFLGGMAVPAVVRYGYGFIQGADAAAKDLGITIDMNYVYGGQFFGDSDITAVMDTWYAGGTEVVFACGGGIYVSACEAAQKVGGKVIGVDTDQSAVIDPVYGEGITITSAMKGLYPTTYNTLVDVICNGKWADYSGKLSYLGLVSGTDPEANYVQIPMGDGTAWNDTFTKDDYKALVADLFGGKLSVTDDTVVPTLTNTNYSEFANIK